MRKILVTLVIVIALAATMSILWMFDGRQLSLFADRFKTIEETSIPINSLTYEGTGTGGTLVINDLHLDLAPANPQGATPNAGTSKDGQLALSFAGKVFSFGPIKETPAGANEILATAPQTGDEAIVMTQHSALDWIEPFKLNFVIGQSPSRKRNVYYRLIWRKPSGAKLEMLWRYEQYFFKGSGWGSGFMTRENSTGLIQIDISQ